MKPLGRHKLAIMGAGFAAILYLLDLGFGLPALLGVENTSVGEILSRRKFESEAWKKAKDGGDTIRIRMVDDLVRTHHLAGMSQTRIDALLGAPEKTTYFREYDYVYWLGPERGFISTDSEWLVLRFEKHIVVEARVLRD